MKLVLVSDTHLTPRTAAFTDNWLAAQIWIEAAAPSLVVHLGDITADGAHDPGELAAARSVFAGLAQEMRFVPGNHDIGDNPVEPGAANVHPLDPARLADYRRLFGPDRGSLEGGPWQLVGLDAQLFGTGTAEEEEQFTIFASSSPATPIRRAGFGSAVWSTSGCPRRPTASPTRCRSGSARRPSAS
jgi:3',5'-cyclic AMP phosphodiesterase CpdA